MAKELSNVELTNVTEYTAHNILNFCITQAVLKNKNTRFKVQLPYETLAKGLGISPIQAAQFIGVALKLTVSLEWCEHDEDTVEIDYE